MSLANVPHGHATPAGQGHFSPTTVPFSIPKLDGEMKTPSGTASDGEGMFFSPALPPPPPTPEPQLRVMEKYAEAKNS